VVEGRVAEMDQMRLTIRDLQNQANAQKDAHDATRRELTETKKLLGSATGLLFEMCLSDERQKRTGTPCKLVQP
jgi:hypothetical protein